MHIGIIEVLLAIIVLLLLIIFGTSQNINTIV